MRIGYNQPLYLLPFDHRHSYLAGMFHFTGVLTADEREMVTDTKRLIYEGFKQALGRKVPVAAAGILIDEEFGAGVLRDAIRHGYVTALSTEKSGSDEFEFEYGSAFADHIEAFRPTFAKALVDGMRPNHDEATMKALEPRIAQLNAIMAAMKEAKKGMAIDLDWRPGGGTHVTIDGKPAGQPIEGEDFYRALLRIWLGDKPVQDDLKKALLGG